MNKQSTTTILTIDDELLARRSFRFFLEDCNFNVIEADSGRTGLEIAEQQPPDLILLDLRMPEMNGLETLARLKGMHPEIPVIVISGTGDILEVIEALRRGACDYLTKPITNLQILEHAVNKSLERARLIKENLAYQKSLESKVQKRTLALEEANGALATSKQTFEAIFQSAPLAIVLLDSLNHITLWNRGAEKLFGWNAEEVFGKACPMFSQLEHKTLTTITAAGLNSYEQVLPNRKQDNLNLRISTAGLGEHPEKPTNVVMLFENITEKKRLQSEADRANRLASLGQLAAGVAHEINNPNGLVLLNMPTLKDMLEDALTQLSSWAPESKVGGLSLNRAQEIAPQLSEEMEDAARRIRQIVEDLKDFASRDAQVLENFFDLNTSVEKALRLVHNNLKKATDNLSCQLASDLPQIHGNPQRIEQVIVNLLVNACESLIDRDAALQIETYLDPSVERVVLCVKDEGRGIRPEDMKHITDPFFTTRRREGGTGLGLSVSSRIVREHGGRLEFDSEFGAGTLARLSFPYNQELG